jgi:hypothetical protein
MIILVFVWFGFCISLKNSGEHQEMMAKCDFKVSNGNSCVSLMSASFTSIFGKYKILAQMQVWRAWQNLLLELPHVWQALADTA